MPGSSENILLFISGFGILQGILLALLIYFHPRSDRSVTLYLALYIACLSIIATTAHIEKLVTWQKSFFIEPYPFLAGPLLYFYILSFKEKITWRKAFPHLILFVVMYFVAYFYLDYWAKKFPDSKDVPVGALQSPIAIAFNLVKWGQLIFYFILSRKTLRSYQQSIRQLFSETSKINLSWTKWLITGFILFIVASVLVYAFMYKYPENFTLWAMIYVALLTPYIYIASFKGITQPTIWQLQPGSSKEQVEGDIKKVSASKPVASVDRIDESVRNIITLMEKEKLYQETELTLQNLADKLQLPAYQVSQVINEKMQKSFYDLVNGYRVEEAKRLLVTPGNKNFTILSIGFEAGFNSKTTFNTVFKKFTGQTPTEYREKQQMALEEA